eukprot:UN00908
MSNFDYFMFTFAIVLTILGVAILAYSNKVNSERKSIVEPLLDEEAKIGEKINKNGILP